MYFDRKPSRTPETLRVKILSSDAPLISELCRTEDVSSFGAQLITERFWMPGFRVLVKSPSGVLWASARVVYCRPLLFNGKLREHFAVGVEFLKQADRPGINSLG